METYSLDIDPAQIVRWLRAEHRPGKSPFRVTARRSSTIEELPTATRFHLGDSEREDLSEVATYATLDIEPLHVNEGWRLSVIIEDEAGPRLSDSEEEDVEEEDEEDVEEEEEIDLETFYEDFIRPGRGESTVIAEVENSAAQARLQPLLKAIEQDRHEEGRTGKK